MPNDCSHKVSQYIAVCVVHSSVFDWISSVHNCIDKVLAWLSFRKIYVLKASFSKNVLQDFNLTQDQLKKVFLLPHEVAFEPYLKACQYKVLNSILFTNKKLCKIGYILDDKCSLCKTDSESLYHIFFEYRHTKQFWKEFQCYYYTLRIRPSDLTRRYYGNIIYKLPLTELFDTDR